MACVSTLLFYLVNRKRIRKFETVSACMVLFTCLALSFTLMFGIPVLTLVYKVDVVELTQAYTLGLTTLIIVAIVLYFIVKERKKDFYNSKNLIQVTILD